jgi:putative DNA primase/helicase
VRAIAAMSSPPKEAAARKRRLRELREKVEAEEVRANEEAAGEAQQRWEQAAPAPEGHGYLKSKQISPCGARIEGGNLLIAMRDIGGKLWSLQSIGPGGNKYNQPGGRRKGCFFTIGEIGDTFCIGEGFSTCASIHMATGYAVVSAGEAGNLETVARVLREKYPAATMAICGDDDWLTRISGKPKNVGKLAAAKAAEAVGGVLTLPWFGSARPPWATDFNDQARLSGLDELATTIRLAIVKDEEDRQRERDAEPPPANPEDFGVLPDGAAPDEGVTLNDFYAYMPTHTYIFAPTRDMWPPGSVNARIAPIPLFDARGEASSTRMGIKNRYRRVHGSIATSPSSR